MRNAPNYIGAIILLLMILLSNSCKKDKPTPPTLSTTSVTSIYQTAAQSGGNVSDDGGADLLSRGICWDVNADPTMDNDHTTESGTLGVFTSKFTSLIPHTKYFVRAYAMNGIGVGYGNQVSFTTSAITTAAMTTSPITTITPTSAISGGIITNDNGGLVSVRGICWGISVNPTTSNSKTTDGTGTGNFESAFSGLQPGTTYYVRSYATNSAGTAYGNELSFITSSSTPQLSTSNTTSILSHSANSGGTITSDGGSSIISKGVCWSIIPGPTLSDQKTNEGSGIGTFNSIINGLLINTKYYIRAYATNIAGTSYGNELSFTTSASLPILSTSEITSITTSSAISGGLITSDGGATVTSRGICWSTETNPTINDRKTVAGAGAGSFSSIVTGLSLNTTYYVKAYATNSAGTSYGMAMSFITLGQLPIPVTNAVTNITKSSIRLNGSVNTNGILTIVTFEYGTTTSYGSTINANPTSTISVEPIDVNQDVANLIPSTTYHYRIKAVNETGYVYGSDITFRTADLVIGDIYEGGMVFFIDPTSRHGLVCALSDQSSTSMWGIWGDDVPGAIGTAVGTGMQNTESIGCSTVYYAACVCKNLTLNGFGDWFLPSKDELNLMYLNLYTLGLGNFANSAYWSSSQLNKYDAWLLAFYNGTLSTSRKDNATFVRAIRAF